VDNLQDACVYCGFTAFQAVEKFRLAAPELGLVHDEEGLLRGRRRERLEEQIREFNRDFPQLSVTIYLTALPSSWDAREFGYWLANASPMNAEEDPGKRFFKLLLVVDDANKQASITTGYALEPFITSRQRTQILAGRRGLFQRRDYFRAPRRTLEDLRRVLAASCRKAGRIAQSYDQEGRAAAPAPAGFPLPARA
jgi:uncharacterized membrane protein YgcG